MYKSRCYIIVCILFILTGCSQENITTETIPSQSVLASETAAPDSSTVTARFEILDVNADGILVYGEKDYTGLYYMTHGADSEPVDDNESQPSDLKPGMLVDVTWDGTMMESYPVCFQYDELKIAEGTEKIEFSFYLQLIKELAQVDPGLNEDIRESYFDFTKLSSLNDGEKEGLAYLCGHYFGCLGSLSTSAELAQSGILDSEKGLEHGILVIVEETSNNGGQLTCNAQKYRSGTGAYYFNDVTAQYEDGRWSFQIGAQLIS